MDAFEQAAERIIHQQQGIIGPVAIEQARKVKGLEVNSDGQVSIMGDKTSILEKLVEQYKELFGQISVEVCKEAAGAALDKLPPQEVPQLLR